jgi:pyruvate,water dikinase
MEEGRMLQDLWSLSRGGLEKAAFLAEHGFHGPDEGELSSRSWREDAAPVDALAGRYRSLEEAASPGARLRAQGTTREEAERELLDRLGGAGRVRARIALAAARRYVPQRETTKTTYLQILDVARACARRLGETLAESQRLQSPDDVFFLTTEELIADEGGDLSTRVVHRRARHAHYLTLTLPETFTGMPEPVSGAAPGSMPVGEVLCGVPVAPGVVEGRVRVVTDPAAADPQPGEVLVCHTTDPSWASLFPLVAAVVIDIGGPLSHGAIIARELGLPCVINTRTGTRVLRTGERVRVDGGRGRVERLGPADEA